MNSFLQQFNDSSAQSSFDSADQQKYKVFAILGYILPILFFLPIVVGDKNSDYCKFHANQQFTWLIAAVLVGAVVGVIMLIPVLGWIIGGILGLAMLAVMICLVYGAATGMALRLPYIGDMISIF